MVDETPATPTQPQVPPPTTKVGSYVSIGLVLATLAIVGGSQFFKKKPEVPVAPVVTAPVQQAPTPVPAVSEGTPTAGVNDLPLDKNTLCDQDCKKIGYLFGAWGKSACHCLNEY